MRQPVLLEPGHSLRHGTLVEGYIAPTGAGSALAQFARLQAAAAFFTDEGDGVACQGALVIPGDETVFWFFESAPPAVVLQFLERAAIPALRIVAAMQIDSEATR